jgi:hypothetical protein
VDRQNRRAAALAAALVAVLCVAVPAAARGQRPAPSAVPPQQPGRPGNPVPIPEGAFTATGRAGSIVHVHLGHELIAPDSGNLAKRFDLGSSGTWAVVSLLPDQKVDGFERSLTLAAVTERYLCGTRTCPNAFTTDVGGTTRLPVGEYIVLLAGPVGSTVTVTLRGYDGPEKVASLTHGLYPMPYVAQDIPNITATGQQLTQGSRGGFALPPLGHRMVAGVVVGMRNEGGGDGGYNTVRCPGGYAHSYSGDLLSGYTAGCGHGYVNDSTSGSVTDGSGGALPLPLHLANQGWARFDVSAATGTQEGFTGASYGAGCTNFKCTFHTVGFVALLDA